MVQTINRLTHKPCREPEESFFKKHKTPFRGEQSPRAPKGTAGASTLGNSETGTPMDLRSQPKTPLPEAIRTPDSRLWDPLSQWVSSPAWTVCFFSQPNHRAFK